MSLRAEVLRGGLYLALRQGVMIPLGLVGVLLLARAIGPEAYGVYAAALALLAFAETIAQGGIPVYLVRRRGEGDIRLYHQAFTLLALLGIGALLASLAALPLVARWTKVEGLAPVALALLAGLPVRLALGVPQARLERALDYRRFTAIDVLGQAAFYGASLALAVGGLGVWAPVVGWWVQQLAALLLLLRAARYRPRLAWSSAEVRAMLGYGLGYSASVWVWRARTLVNPLVVGHYAGAAAVGYVALAIRLVEALGFVKTATWRLSLPALARVQDNRAKLVAAVTEGMRLQVLAVGPLLVAFAWLGPWVVPALFGPAWAPVLGVFPFIALGYLANSMFNLHSSVLYVLERNWEVTGFHVVHVVLFAGAAVVLVPELGLIAYGLAELVAVASYAVVHAAFVRHVGRPGYRQAALGCGTLGAALFGHQLGWWTVLPLVILALWPETIRELLGAVGRLRELARVRPT